MAGLGCAEARDLACDLLVADLTAERARLLKARVPGCPTCPRLCRAPVAVHRELARLRREAQAADGSSGG